MRRVGVTLIAALGNLLYGHEVVLAQEVKLRVAFREVSDLIYPGSMQTVTNFNYNITLHGRGELQSSSSRFSGRTNRQESAAFRLGEVRGGDRVSWHVNGQNELIGMNRYQNAARAIRVIVTGASCQATVGYSLDRGQTEIRFKRLTTGGEGVSRKIVANGVSCSIGQ